jgi:hypothetical protein
MGRLRLFQMIGPKCSGCWGGNLFKSWAMTKRPKKTAHAVNGYVWSFRGSASFSKSFLESIEGLPDEAEAIGIPGLEGSEAVARLSALPNQPTRSYRGSMASAVHIMFMMEIIAFPKEPVTKALVQVASSEFFRLVLPKIGKMFAKRRSHRVPYPIIFRPAMYFEAEQVLVTAIMTIGKADDYKCAESLVPQAFERAVDWLERNGRQAPYLTYRIVDCRLNSFPSLSHEPPAD